MSYKTLEVELENGRVHASGAERLPAKARALLTILTVNGNTELPAGTLAGCVAHLAGIGRGQHSDLSTNPAHLDDFGR
ncbi:MAG: hypothetical protein KGJ60_14210 [Verrucomicrobiota bacterium]|nr:hypothetical protein [Verrucomicrobiota bacterium]